MAMVILSTLVKLFSASCVQNFFLSCFDLVYVTIVRVRLIRVRLNKPKFVFSAFSRHSDITTQSNNNSCSYYKVKETPNKLTPI